jgi:hypothetical protein
MLGFVTLGKHHVIADQVVLSVSHAAGSSAFTFGSWPNMPAVPLAGGRRHHSALD